MSTLPPTWPTMPQPEGATPFLQPQDTALATTSLVLGIIAIPTVCVCVGPLLGLVAVILGIVALVQVGNQPERFGGKGRAIGGIVTGSIGIVLIFAAGMMAVPLARKFGGAFQAGVNLGLVADGLRSYQTKYNDYPPDLGTLVESGYVMDNILAQDRESSVPTRGLSYVVGIKPDDPPHWILAFTHTTIMGQKLDFVIYAHGNYELLDPAQFTGAMTRFKQEYEQFYGHPPTILEPSHPPATEPSNDEASHQKPNEE
jgi:hypothetical protein